MSSPSEGIRRARIFISYKRNVDPDEPVAKAIFEALKLNHEVFIDQTMLVGTQWAQKIEQEIERSDYLITFLSANSVNSEMVLAEIETAHRLSKEKKGPPVILPVRLVYTEPFKYPLSAYLNPINWAIWKSSDDTAGLIKELSAAVCGNQLSSKGTPTDADRNDVVDVPQPLHSAQPISLDSPEGTIDSESKLYISRPTDSIALQAIGRSGVTITIKGPRQMGKSSLLIRTMQSAKKVNKKIAFLDFQLLDKTSLASADVFFRQFCSWISDVLELEDKSDEYWKAPLGNSQRCSRYMSRYLLKQFDGTLVLAMDEVESIFETDYRTDFFSMLRNWHNSRAVDDIWKRLDLALVTSTEPYQLIENLHQSPFNVGDVIEMCDFTMAEVDDLNTRHGTPLNSDELKQLVDLLNGHPYLTRKTFYLIRTGRSTVADLFANSADDRGPFGDHLRYHLFRLNNQEQLIRGLKQILINQNCQDEETFFRLRGAGLVSRQGPKEIMRCKLYANYFTEYLHV